MLREEAHIRIQEPGGPAPAADLRLLPPMGREEGIQLPPQVNDVTLELRGQFRPGLVLGCGHLVEVVAVVPQLWLLFVGFYQADDEIVRPFYVHFGSL